MSEQKVAIVTAGGSGMGAGAARRMAAEGYKVAVLSSSGKGEALARELGGIGVTGSNQSSDDLKRLVDAAYDAWGRVDALINSAGHGPRAPVLELTDEEWHKGMEVYFLNVVRPTRLVTPIMMEQKSGSIVNISTYATFEPDPLFPTSGGLPFRTCRFHQAFRRPLCPRQYPHEQCSAGLYRQSAGNRGTAPAHPDRALRDNGGGGRAGCAARQRSWGLHHRSKHPGRRWHHPIRLTLPTTNVPAVV